MDAGVADTINRRSVRLMAAFLDQRDKQFYKPVPWYERNLGNILMGDTSDRAWFVGAVAALAPGLTDVDYAPADCDWDNLFSHFRAEIQARRDRDSHTASAA